MEKFAETIVALVTALTILAAAGATQAKRSQPDPNPEDYTISTLSLNAADDWNDGSSRN